MEEVRKLKLVIKKNSYVYSQLLRNEKFAIYGQYDPSINKVIAFEIFRIYLIKRMQVKIPEKNFYMQAGIYEKFPSDSDFGKTAWSFTDYERAKKRFDEKTLNAQRK
jgi:hypothetical protein